MNEPIVFKRGTTVALLALLRRFSPALISVGMLFGVATAFGADFDTEFLMMAIFVAILAPAVLQLPGTPSTQLIQSEWPTVAGLIMRWLLLLAILLAIAYVTKVSGEFSRRVVLTWATLTPVILIAVVVAFDELLKRYVAVPGNVRRAVFAGFNSASQALAHRLGEHRDLGVEVVGFFDDRSFERLGMDQEASLLGGLGDLPGMVQEHRLDVIFIALPMRHVQRVLHLLDELHDTTASIYYVPDIFVFDLIQSRAGEILGVPVVAMCETPFRGYRGMVKRAMDVSMALVALLLLSPLMLALALAIRLDSPGPALFKQRRYGLDGREINIYKFRSMNVLEDGAEIRQATRNDARVTRLGSVMRRYSLDELPQLFNVLQGRMSMVGPRPHAVAHNEQYRSLIKGYMIRHKVLPGITGLAQVSGCRGETARLEDMRARIEHDLDYLRHWTPMLDLVILFKTARVLLGDRKAY